MDEMLSPIGKLVQSGKKLFNLYLGSTGQNFADSTWDISSLSKSLTNTRTLYLHFTCYDALHDELPEEIALIAKSFLLESYRTSAEDLRNRLGAIKALWHVIGQRHSATPF